MKTIKVFGIIALTAIFTLSAATCFSQSGGGGGKTLNSAEALKEYLDSQPANSPDKPIKVSMGANAPMLPKIASAINSAGKYVSLNITGNLLTTIPDYALEDCETLVSITIPNSVTIIEYEAFRGCSSLTSITIPNSVTSIGREAFAYCTSLTSVTIPNSVTSIGREAFSETEWFNNQPDGLVYAGKVAYKYKGDMPKNTSITLLDGTKEIAGRAFSGCENLTSITIPNSVTSIEEDVFYGCTRLASVTFQGTISSENFSESALSFSVLDVYSTRPYYRAYNNTDLRTKYLAGGPGTYKTTAPVNYRSTWKKQ